MAGRGRLTSGDLARIALFAALIAALGLPGQLMLGPVPITAQTLGVMLAGSILGARNGALAALVFMILTLAGLPLLAGGRGGLGVLAAPSAGYFLGFVFGAFVTGWLTERILPRYRLPLGILANVVGGVLVVYALGIPIQAIRTDTDLWVAILTPGIGAITFLPGDLLKAVIAAVVTRGVHRARPISTRGPASPSIGATGIGDPSGRDR